MSLMLFLLLLLTLFVIRFIWPLVRIGIGIHRQVRNFQKNQPKAPTPTASRSGRPVKGEYIEFEEVK